MTSCKEDAMFRVECCVCGEHLGGPEVSVKVSHGYCPPCVDRELIRWHRQIDPPWVAEVYCDEGGEA